jgi:hypothetical protein
MDPAGILKGHHFYTVSHLNPISANIAIKDKGRLFRIFLYVVLYSTLLHLSPLRFHCVGGCLDQICTGQLRV